MNKDVRFLDYYAKESPKPFYVMLALFVITNMLLVIKFTDAVSEKVAVLRLGINSVLLILCVMYLAFQLLLWRLKPLTGVIAVGLIAVAGLSWNTLGHTYEFFCTTVAVFLALLAYKRDYRVILKIFLACHLMTMLAAIAGLFLGYAEQTYKLGTDNVGVSLGLIYPNHVGRMVFMILLIIWYLWGQKKRLVTTIVSFVTAFLMWEVVKCKTIALFLVAFPLCWWMITWLNQRTADKHASGASEEELSGVGQPVSGSGIGRVFVKMIRALLTVVPFLGLAVTYLLGLCRNFFMAHWHFGQGIYALWMRFISAGILFRSYGFPLFGRPLEERSGVLEVTNGQGYVAVIVDNSYVFYLLAIGGIALIGCMLWLSFGNYRMLKQRDDALLLISVFMCGYGLIETVYFQFEHNFLWFYPLAAVGKLMADADMAEAEEAETGEMGTDTAETDIPDGKTDVREPESVSGEEQ